MRSAKRCVRALQYSTKRSIPYDSMSRLFLKPSSFSASTSIHSPWQSNPFW